MTENNITLYTIPVDDKYIIYAPLKPLAFIGNRALVNTVTKHMQDPQKYPLPDSEPFHSLQEIGLFAPDNKKILSCNGNQPFNPTLCILMPTTACNLACTYCYASSGNKKHVFLSWPTAKKAIDLAYENSIKYKKGRFSLSFHGGGEPTLAKELFLKACNYAKSLDPRCPISVTSNCVWDKKFRDKALDLLSEISISFDGSQPTQDRQRPDTKGAGTFTRVMETLREIEKRNIQYGIRITVTRESLNELCPNVEFLCDHTACKSFQVEAVYDQGRASGTDMTIDDVGSFVKVFMEAHNYAKERGKLVHYSAARPHITTNTFCTATSNALIVTSDGELTACYEVFDHSHPLEDDFIIGKLNQNEGLELYPGKREKLLDKIASNRDSCKNCFCFYHCAGDCPPKAFLANINNDMFRCSVTRAITRELLLEKITANNGIWPGDISKQRYSVKQESC